MKTNKHLQQLILNSGESSMLTNEVFNPYHCKLLQSLVTGLDTAIPGLPDWHARITICNGYAYFLVCHENRIKATITMVAWNEHGAKKTWNDFTKIFESEGARIDGSSLDVNGKAPERPTQVPWFATYYFPAANDCPLNHGWIEGFSRSLAAAIIKHEVARHQVWTEFEVGQSAKHDPEGYKSLF